MKKTIALLLAMAGMAMGASEIDLTNKWSDNTVALSEQFTNGEASFIFTLNVEAIQAWVSDENRVNTPIAYLSGVNTSGLTSDIGISLFIGDGVNGLKAWRYNEFFKGNNMQGNNYQGSTIDVNMWSSVSYTYAALVVSVSDTGRNGTKLVGNLFLLDENMNKVGDYITTGNAPLGSTQMTDKQYTSFTINADYVNSNQVALYNGILNGEDIQLAEIQDLLSHSSSPAAPEPTTATLSLLALAGLAARRRRK